MATAPAATSSSAATLPMPMPGPAPLPTGSEQIGGSASSTSAAGGARPGSLAASSNVAAAAGFRQINTNVRRCGDFGDYFFDGSWKASSFVSPPGHLDTELRTPWTKTLNFVPRSGKAGPPALWPIDHVTKTPTVPQEPVWGYDKLSLRGNHVPGYSGFIPGEKAETIYGSLRSGISDHAEGIRPYEEKDVSLKPILYNNPTIGRMPLKKILKTTDLIHTVSYGNLEPNPGSRLKQYKDHVPPPRITPNCSSTGILGWSGFRPVVNRNLDGRKPSYLSHDVQMITGKNVWNAEDATQILTSILKTQYYKFSHPLLSSA
ncbi:unnamed protein product [Amoebophrya sp. A120]|nr:unnamed protein product [Amoebophrya sp. A120]|eukprot:GSA120T00009833001.1